MRANHVDLLYLLKFQSFRRKSYCLYKLSRQAGIADIALSLRKHFKRSSTSHMLGHQESPSMPRDSSASTNRATHYIETTSSCEHRCWDSNWTSSIPSNFSFHLRSLSLILLENTRGKFYQILRRSVENPHWHIQPQVLPGLSNQTKTCLRNHIKEYRMQIWFWITVLVTYFQRWPATSPNFKILHQEISNNLGIDSREWLVKEVLESRT